MTFNLYISGDFAGKLVYAPDPMTGKIGIGMTVGTTNKGLLVNFGGRENWLIDQKDISDYFSTEMELINND